MPSIHKVVKPSDFQAKLPLDSLLVSEPAGENCVPMDVLFVGAGPAGLAGAIELKRLVKQEAGKGGAPGDVSPALATTEGVTVAYPNSGQGWDARARAWTGESAFDAGDVEAWLDAGARLVGGCCRVGPGQVASMAEAIAVGAR